MSPDSLKLVNSLEYALSQLCVCECECVGGEGVYVQIQETNCDKITQISCCTLIHTDPSRILNSSLFSCSKGRGSKRLRHCTSIDGKDR